MFRSISCTCDPFDQVVFDIRLVVYFSISCKCDFCDQLCWIFDQLSIFRSDVSVTFVISCAGYSISCVFFDQL